MENIDIEKAIEDFIKYTKKFDLENKNIKRKQLHSLRVMKISKQIAEMEKFTDEEIKLAMLIGLLHDIARFKQYTEYKTFHDGESFDHGDVGVEILENDDYINNYTNNEKYKKILKLAIKNHNKLDIEESLTDEEYKYCKLIRDTDKIDILYETKNVFFAGIEDKVEETTLTEGIEKNFFEGKLVVTNNIQYTLVVTIIVLIILAGVSINLMFGQYGIVTRAK